MKPRKTLNKILLKCLVVPALLAMLLLGGLLVLVSFDISQVIWAASSTGGFLPGVNDNLKQGTFSVHLTTDNLDLRGVGFISPTLPSLEMKASQGNGYFFLKDSLGYYSSWDVSLGDLNGDDHLDVFVANRGVDASVNGNRVWLNDGNGKLSDTGQSLGESDSEALALGDLDADGDLDAFIANTGEITPASQLRSRANMVWLNDGNGNFSKTVQDLGGSKSVAVALGDVDDDGDLDALVGNCCHVDVLENANKLWINDGTGIFSYDGRTLGYSSTIAVSLGDLDGDGDLDAFIGNGGEANEVWTNDGNGLFTNSKQALGKSNTAAIALGDLDGDGDLDAFVGNRGKIVGEQVITEPNEIWLNNGEGDFTDSSQRLGAFSSEAAALGDLDSDGDLDAVVANGFFSDQPNSIWFNEGGIQRGTQGEFSRGIQTLGNRASEAAALGDLNGDGALDIFIGNGESQPNQVWLNTLVPCRPDINLYKAPVIPRDATLWANYPYTITSTAITSETLIVHGGQTGILAGTHCVYHKVVAFKPHSPFKPGELVQVSATSNTASMSSGTAGLPPDSISPKAQRFWAEVEGGSGKYENTGQRLGHRFSWQVALGDMDSDGHLDAVVANGNGANTIWKNDGTGNLNIPLYTLSEMTSEAVVLGDLNGDGSLDVFVANSMYEPNEVWLNNGDGTVMVQPHNWPGLYSTSADVGDVDGDGDLDVLVGNWKDMEVPGSPPFNKLWLNDGLGRFADSGQTIGYTVTLDVALGDFNRDGYLDAFIGNGSGQPNEIWMNLGSGVFTGPIITPNNDDTRAVALGDLDGDGFLDVFVANTTTQTNRVLRNNQQGGFDNISQTWDGKVASSLDVALGDVDHDGDLDAVVANEYQPNRIWLNDGQGNFSLKLEFWNQEFMNIKNLSVALGDINGDGWLDILVGKEAANEVWINSLYKVFLPVVLKPVPSTPLFITATYISINGLIDIEIRDPQDNDRLLGSCKVEDGNTQFCARITPVSASYTIVADSTICGVREWTFHNATPGITVTQKIACEDYLTHLWVRNNSTGGDTIIEVLGTGVQCIITNNATEFCGSFDPGKYVIKLTAVCGTDLVSDDFDKGRQERSVSC